MRRAGVMDELEPHRYLANAAELFVVDDEDTDGDRTDLLPGDFTPASEAFDVFSSACISR